MKYDCAIGFAFGFREVGGVVSPGLSNIDLARCAEGLHVPLLLQYEIADALSKDVAQAVFRIEKHTIKGEYLDTREVAVQAREIMRSRAWVGVVVLAHPDHLERCINVCEKLGVNVVEAPRLDIRYDPDSAQEWTRSADSFKPREEKATAYYRDKGWV